MNDMQCLSTVAGKASIILLLTIIGGMIGLARLSLTSDFKDFSGDQKAGLAEAVNLPGGLF